MRFDDNDHDDDNDNPNPAHNTATREWRPATLLLPRIRVQNANAISSPLTWGFPAITAFTGLMVALERKLGAEAGLRLQAVGVVCHGFEAQTHQGSRYAPHRFKLSRNPVGKDGGTAAIVEEGRVHLEVSLVFQAQLHARHATAEQCSTLAQQALHALQSLRVAGGSVVPPTKPSKRHTPWLTGTLLEGPNFKALARRLLPGFALVLRDDLLQQQLAQQRQTQPSATVLDAWLHLCALRYRAPGTTPPQPGPDGKAPAKLRWAREPRPGGWLVPMPVGFTGLTPLQAPGQVANARQPDLPLRFVETVWSLGEWLSPHRLQTLTDLLWRPETQDANGLGLYRCRNNYQPPPQPQTAPTALAAAQ
jgi:CRISPR-associated protein Csy2